MTDKDLEELREKIDEIDRKLIDLFSQRMEIAESILEIKKEMGKEIRDKEREQKVLEKVRDLASEKNLDNEFAEDVMRITMSRTVGAEREIAGSSEIWAKIQDIFSSNPAQLKVARVLYKYGFSVRENGDVVCGNIRVPSVQIAEEAGVDRRAVDSTAKTIFENEDLREIFTNLRPVPYLKGVARQMGLGVIEILPTDATQSGIISEVTDVISSHGVTVRQSITDDPYFTDQPKLTIITEDVVSGDIIEELRELPSVESLIVY